jgi:pimeloyl-ACP methyl ester carboxylesterase
MTRFSVFLLAILVLMIAFFAAFQRRLIYYPTTGTAEALAEFARAEGFEALQNPAGETIAYLHSPRDVATPEAVFIVFHGNAGFALHRSYYRDALREVSADRWACVVLEYPGYGARAGSPSKNTLEAAAAEVLEVVLARHPVPVYLIGESLGSGVATSLAASHPDKVSGLILVTPFTSLAAVGRHHYPFLPVRLLLRDNFDNVRNLKQYQGPVAVVLAEDDRIIPAAIGKKLYDAYEGPRRLWTQPGAGHNTLDLNPQNPMWKEMGEFLFTPPADGPGS